MNRRGVQWLALIVAGAVALAAGVWLARPVPPSPPPSGAAATLLGVALPDLNGREQALRQWQGKVLVVNFWATWCAPCREEMPAFVKMQRERGSEGLQFVGIGIDDAAKLRQFAEEIGLNYPALVGGYGALELSKTLGNTLVALPFTVIVDRAGRIAHTQLGPLKPDKLAAIVGQLL